MRPRKKKEPFIGLAAQLVACEKSNKELRKEISDCRRDKSEGEKESKRESKKLVTKNIHLSQQNAALMAETKLTKNANKQLKNINARLLESNARLQESNNDLASAINKANHAEVALKQLVDKRLVCADFLEKITQFKEKFTLGDTDISAKIADVDRRRRLNNEEK